MSYGKSITNEIVDARALERDVAALESSNKALGEMLTDAVELLKDLNEHNRTFHNRRKRIQALLTRLNIPRPEPEGKENDDRG